MTYMLQACKRLKAMALWFCPIMLASGVRRVSSFLGFPPNVTVQTPLDGRTLKPFASTVRMWLLRAHALHLSFSLRFHGDFERKTRRDRPPAWIVSVSDGEKPTNVDPTSTTDAHTWSTNSRSRVSSRKTPATVKSIRLGRAERGVFEKRTRHSQIVTRFVRDIPICFCVVRKFG